MEILLLFQNSLITILVKTLALIVLCVCFHFFCCHQDSPYYFQIYNSDEWSKTRINKPTEDLHKWDVRQLSPSPSSKQRGNILRKNMFICPVETIDDELWDHCFVAFHRNTGVCRILIACVTCNSSLGSGCNRISWPMPQIGFLCQMIIILAPILAKVLKLMS